MDNEVKMKPTGHNLMIIQWSVDFTMFTKQVITINYACHSVPVLLLKLMTPESHTV